MASQGIAPKPGQVPTNAAWGKAPVGDSEDLQRILRLDRRPPPTDEEKGRLAKTITGMFAKKRTTPCRCNAIRPNEDGSPACITELRYVQCWALLEMMTAQGLLGSIGVGHGKTILDILTALAIPNCKTALLLCKPDLVAQLIIEYELLSQHFEVPSIVVHSGRDYSQITPGKPILHVMPFSRLCRKTASDFIAKVAPDTIIVDEVQRLRDPQTATSSRVLRHFDEFPDTRFAGWTGTLSDTSIKDYAHLAALALKYKSPLPLDPIVVDDWARCLDPSPVPAPAGKLFLLCNEGEHVESGFNRRLMETQGVVGTTSSAIDAPLVITERKTPPMPEVIKDALCDLRDNWRRPDGEQFVEAFEVSRSAREVACGFHYRWKFTRDETEEQIAKWLDVRKRWNRELRDKLAPRELFLDSPLLCMEAAMRHHKDIDPDMCQLCKGEGMRRKHRHDGVCDGDLDGECWQCYDFTPDEVANPCQGCNATGRSPCNLPLWDSECWPAWREIRHTVKPETEVVRIDPYLAQDAADWGLSHLGVVWYSYNAFGNWVGELSGLPVHGGGPKAVQRIAAEKGDRSIIASTHAHGTGRDGLQRLFKEQLITNPMSSSTGWEQLLGRLHRIGQKASRVTAELYRHTPEFRASVDKAVSRALYVEQTLGAEQKLLVGFDL